MRLEEKELDLIRQWFNCVQDLNPKYLIKDDYVLAKKIFEFLKYKVPDSILYNIGDKKG